MRPDLGVRTKVEIPECKHPCCLSRLLTLTMSRSSQWDYFHTNLLPLFPSRFVYRYTYTYRNVKMWKFANSHFHAFMTSQRTVVIDFSILIVIPGLRPRHFQNGNNYPSDLGLSKYTISSGIIVSKIQYID